jgi:ribonuclease VapC
VIVLDTSALMAIIQGEAEATRCRDEIGAHADLLIAAPNLSETLIVAAGRRLDGEMGRLLKDLRPTIVPLTEERAYAATRAYLAWGKGFHPAHLNFGDCFALALAKENDCPLLFVGDDFATTDVKGALD